MNSSNKHPQYTCSFSVLLVMGLKQHSSSYTQLKGSNKVSFEVAGDCLSLRQIESKEIVISVYWYVVRVAQCI